MNFKDPEGQVAGWLEALTEYDFKIKHCSGKKHQNADALSRREESSPTPKCPSELLACSSLQIAADEAQLEETRNAYSADVDLSVVVDRLSSGKHGCVPGSLMSQVNSSKLENRLLYRKSKTSNQIKQKKKKKKKEHKKHTKKERKKLVYPVCKRPEKIRQSK